MGRRKKSEIKPPPRLIRHFLDGSRSITRVVNLPAGQPPEGRIWAKRLGWHHQGGPSRHLPENLARTIRHWANDDVRWFCDTNFFIAPTDERIWDALLAKRGRLWIAAPVYRELTQWLDEPVNNRPIADEVAKSYRNRANAAIQFLDFPQGNELLVSGLEYYINLLGMRKQASRIAEAVYTEEKGRSPNNQELSNYIKDKLGMRAQLLARKGVTAKVGAHKYNDEVTVVLAMSEAIRTGRETVILTRDEDVLEQFYKFMWLFDTHYRAMLLAERYAADPFLFHPVRRVEDVDRDAFEGEIILLPKPSDHLEEVLPAIFRQVPVHCMLIKDETIHSSFMAERGMTHILDMKGRTGGMSTDRLGDRNCHIYLGNRTRKWGNNAAIGRDLTFKIGSRNTKWSLSIIDLNIATVDCEPVIRLREVLPQLILLPR